jgi:DNA-binding CsgD family transcriptional regulator
MPNPDTQHDFDELVRLCYECILDESRWPVLLDSLVTASERQKGAFLLISKRTESAQVTEINNLDDGQAEDYNTYYHQIDPSYLFMPQRDVGHWYHDFIDYGDQAIARSPYYQEFHRNSNLGNTSCVKLYENDRASAYLSLLSSWDNRLERPLQQKLLQRLTPHLSLAGRIAERLQDQIRDIAKRDLLLGQHATPLWLLNETGRVVFCNLAAERHLMQESFALFEKFGQLQSRQHNDRLQTLLQLACGKNGPPRTGWLQFDGSPGHYLLVSPVPAQNVLAIGAEGSLALLVLLGQQASTQNLAELFQLSPAEQRLAGLLSQGLSPEQCAARHGVSINTVRCQLRALYRKTRTQRQSELVSLIGRLAGQRA